MDLIEPAAWLIEETKRGRRNILSTHIFKSEERARQAAERMTTKWRRCRAVPVAIIQEQEEPADAS